ncbi:MAG TPA: radical SAM protein [Spirochaetia bacterium]|nr:radical SAM protein [Spirochaetia bacterium]
MKTNFSIVPKIVIKNPLIALNTATSFLMKNKSMMVDYHLHNGKTNELSLMYFRLTPLCNLRCLMCGQRGDKGVLKGSFAVEESKKVLPFEAYKKLVDEVAPKKPTVYLWGGEPFLYPDLFPLVRYMIDSGLVVSVNTNGTLLEKNAERVVAERWHSIFVSLDGFEEVNDRIRGTGSYKRVVEGFKAINREKKRQGTHLPYMGIVTTVSNLNYLYIGELAEAAREFGLAWHIFNLGTYTNRTIIENHRKFMKEKLDTDIKCIEGFETGYNEGIDGQRLYEILTHIHSMDTGYPIITVPALKPDKINIYYGDLETPVRTRCPIPWSQVNIDYNGDVHFCADYPDYVIGNITEDNFFSIFNGEKAIRFRKALKETPNGMFPGCIRCYQNMLFGKKIRGF